MIFRETTTMVVDDNVPTALCLVPQPQCFGFVFAISISNLIASVGVGVVVAGGGGSSTSTFSVVLHIFTLFVERRFLPCLLCSLDIRRKGKMTSRAKMSHNEYRSALKPSMWKTSSLGIIPTTSHGRVR